MPPIFDLDLDFDLLQQQEEDAAFRAASDAFMKWVSDHGAVVSPDIELADLRKAGRGRGVVAKADIPADALLFSIPRTLVLTARNSSLPATTREALEDEPWLAIIGALMHEHLLAHPLSPPTALPDGEVGEDGAKTGAVNGTPADATPPQSSFWQPYLDVLPTAFDSPMFWTLDELASLQASALRARIGRNETDEVLRDRVIPHVRGKIGKIGTENGQSGTTMGEDEKALLHLAHIMGSRVMAYAFDVSSSTGSDEGGDADEDGYLSDPDDADLPKGMVPLADMLNADADLNNARLFHTPTSLEMRALHPIPAGHELLNDYGPLPRAELLRRYGYVSDRYARYDVCELSRDLLVACAQEAVPKPVSKTRVAQTLKLFRQLDELEDGWDLHRSEVFASEATTTTPAASAGDDPSSSPGGEENRSTEDRPVEDRPVGDRPAVVTAPTLPSDPDTGALRDRAFPPPLLAFLRTLTAPAGLFAKLSSKRRLAPATGPMDAHDAVTRILLLACRRRLEEYGTSAAEDGEVLERTGKGRVAGRMRMGVQVRLGEKEVLREAIRLLEGLGRGGGEEEEEEEEEEENGEEPQRKRARVG